MSICLAIQSVSDNTIEKILADPPLIWRLIAPDDRDAFLQCMVSTKTKPGFLSKLFSKGSDVSEVPDLRLLEGEGECIDLDKSWHGIHYCLNKTSYEAEAPKDFLTVGGEAIGDIDIGYGPARALRSGVVKEIAQWLNPLTIDLLKHSFDPEEMVKLEIYPKLWVAEGAESFGYIEEFFRLLQGFVERCAGRGLGMIVYLS